MAEPVTRVSRPADPAAIEGALAALWREVGRDGPVARAVMANLVVYRGTDSSVASGLESSFAAPLIEEVARRHPSRIILLQDGGGSKPATPIDAAVGILLFGPSSSRFGVEAIAVRADCTERSWPSIVRRLSFGDTPTSILWPDDVSRVTPLEPIVAIGRQFVFDSRRWSNVLHGVLAILPFLARSRPVDLADVNWRRLTPMRQAIAQALGAAMTPVEAEAARFHIRHAPGEAALAWLLAGWLCSRLGWAAADATRVCVEEARQGEDVLSLTVGNDFTATLDARRASVAGPGRAAPVSIAVPYETEADAIVAELRNLTRDLCLIDALLALPRLLTSGRQ